MEKYFNPGFKTKPGVHVGSQSVKFFQGNPREQTWEGFHLAGAFNGDVIVVRDLDPNYVTYWNNFTRDLTIINLSGADKGKFLTEIILKDKHAINLIKKKMEPDSKLMVSHPTNLEQKLAEALNIPLHGSPRISELYGTKSGIRHLAKEFNLQMPPGFICSTYSQVEKAISILQHSFDEIVIKHNLSLSGYFSKKIKAIDNRDLKVLVDEVCGGQFSEGKDIVVVEGWLRSKTSLCAHIEILEGKEPIICSAWQQIIDSDGISYMGASPLMISEKAFDSFLRQVWKLAFALKEKGAIGSFGPDFLITGGKETNLERDTSVLLELNARAPYTAYPLQLIKNIKGNIGNGFYTKHIKLKHRLNFVEIRKILETNNLLITRKSRKASGVIPHNIGLLPWKLFDILAIGNSWEETINIMEKIDLIFDQKRA